MVETDPQRVDSRTDCGILSLIIPFASCCLRVSFTLRILAWHSRQPIASVIETIDRVQPRGVFCKEAWIQIVHRQGRNNHPRLRRKHQEPPRQIELCLLVPRPCRTITMLPVPPFYEA